MSVQQPCAMHSYGTTGTSWLHKPGVSKDSRLPSHCGLSSAFDLEIFDVLQAQHLRLGIRTWLFRTEVSCGARPLRDPAEKRRQTGSDPWRLHDRRHQVSLIGRLAMLAIIHPLMLGRCGQQHRASPTPRTHSVVSGKRRDRSEVEVI